MRAGRSQRTVLSISEASPQSETRKIPEHSFRTFPKPTSDAVVPAKPHFKKGSVILKFFKQSKQVFGQHQSMTYENTDKMTLPEVMLWCRPNDNLVKIAVFNKKS